MMTLQELEPSIRHLALVIAIVINNNLYGMIRAHQEKHFPDRVVGTELTNPDYAELAKLFGGFGVRVEKKPRFHSRD